MRKFKDNILKSLLYICAAITMLITVVIIGYIFINGIGGVNLRFLTGKYKAGGGGGIFPMIITTLLTILISLLVSVPIGICGAIYLTEYAKQGKILKIIRFATDSLAGIPSIIYGLFGMTFFVTALKMGFSVLSGALTLAIIVLPVIISTTEEALNAVPQSYREGAIALGSTKFELLYKIVVPASMPGIVSGIILSMGRIIGESAALVLTLGTVASLPKSLLSSGRTLTVHAYLLAKETGNIKLASSVGVVLILIILILNIIAKAISNKIISRQR